MPQGYDWAIEPLAGEGAPCGPDLEAADDPDFVDWYFTSMGELPERYVTQAPSRGGDDSGGDRAFDPRSVDLKSEKVRADTVLMRSRDLRVLSLMVRWELLAGRAAAAAEAMDTVASLIEDFPADVHPRAPSERRDALLDLADPATSVQALLHLNLAGANEVSLRRMRVATGESPARSYETGLDAASMTEELARPASRATVQASVDAIDRMAMAIARIGIACRRPEAGSLSPDLSALTDTLAAIRALLSRGIPDLSPLPVAEMAAPAGGQAGGPADAPSDAAVPPALTSSLSVTPPTGAAGARTLLEACERYFRTQEPSSAALLLVTQARLLVGRPLIEAIETLMPADAPRVTVTLGSSGFALSADRLRALSGDASLPPSDVPVPEEAISPIPTIRSGADVTAILAAVETHYAMRERSSPIPLLLARARATIGKDFQSLIAEFLPQVPG